MTTLTLPSVNSPACFGSPEPELAIAGQLVPPCDHAVRRQVRDLLVKLRAPYQGVERRLTQRYAYPHLLYLTPVADDGVTPVGESVVVVGKQLSETGLCFYHQRPLAPRQMIASLEGANRQWVGFLLDISWCRFTAHGWYDSGGQFLEAVASPLNLP
jgi:hypothetical protein